MEDLKKFDDIDVKLVSSIFKPYELSVATARTCYSGKGVVYPEDVSKDDRAVALRDKIADSTLHAGHVTTRQHAHFVFSMSGVSRQFIWSFLHSHPFYNSEQVSQRYVKVKRGSFIVPPLSSDQRDIYTSTIESQMAAYENLIKALKPMLSEDYYERFKSRKKYADKWDGSIDKRCYEVARYALPVGTTAYLYHTISALTLLRYAKLSRMFETPDEQKIVIDKMLALVKAADPLFEKEIPDPLPLEKTLEYELFKNFQETRRDSNAEFLAEFDDKLGGKTSRLVNYSSQSEVVLADAVRVALGRRTSELSDADALGFLLDPKKNPQLADTLGIMAIDRLSQLLHHVHFTFQKKISHTADSQDQRHRTVLSSRPILKFHYSGKPDFVTPYGITANALANEIYEESMERAFDGINRLLDRGVKEEYAFYLLPNSYPIRMISSGDLHSYHHKWKMRSCYNAQEEIFRATIDEIEQVNAVLPKIGEHLRAPCYLRMRAGITPFCPEGDRYCGLPVWKYAISDYQRKSL